VYITRVSFVFTDWVTGSHLIDYHRYLFCSPTQELDTNRMYRVLIKR